ncbi:lipopolysaccharide biosynthesis protein [Vibrio splendidus]|uniref:lipopolysaccharide biosynthesis protein n=1 Tax=Vibrio splendidus TaxID=29497 RepID=UPI000D3C80DB|nr:oligosaccharide flippase family protein [Vibrio splendidus]PTO58119.1 polysaccharide biosynthesis protein [Vibrio splendidus]
MIKNSAVYLSSNIVSAAMPFFLLPVLTRYLDTEEYGQLAMFQLVCVGVLSLISTGVIKASSRTYYDNSLSEDDFKKYIFACLYIPFFIMVVLIASGLYFREYFTTWIGIPIEWIVTATIVGYLNLVTQIRLTQWQVRKRAISYGLLQVVSSLTNLLLSILLVVVILKGVEGRVLAIAISSCAISIIASMYMVKEKVIKIKYSKEILNKVLMFGLPLTPHAIGLFILSFSDRYIINKYLGLSETGIYLAAFQLSMVFQIILTSIDKAYVPWLYKKLTDNVNNTEVVKKIYSMLVVYFFVGVLLYLLSPWLVYYILGSDYQEASNILGFLFLAQSFYGGYLLVNNIVFFAKKNMAMSVHTITTGTFHIICMIIFVQRFGIVGAAYAFVLSKAIQFIGAWALAYYSHQLPWLTKK